MCISAGVYNLVVIYCKVDETITTIASETEAAAAADAGKEDTQIKPSGDGESLEATPSEQTRAITPSPSKRMMEIVAEAGGSARHLLAHIRSERKRGTHETLGFVIRKTISRPNIL